MILYKTMKLLKNETVCNKLKEKYEKMANEEDAKIPSERKCRNCHYGRFIKNESILGCGFECKLNPLQPVALGLEAKHSDRKE